MKKILINSDYGGFSLSDKALQEYIIKKDLPLDISTYNDIFDEQETRSDPILIEIVERLGKKANDICANLKIIKIPDDIDWIIEEYDGLEWIAEKHRKWY